MGVHGYFWDEGLMWTGQHRKRHATPRGSEACEGLMYHANSMQRHAMYTVFSVCLWLFMGRRTGAVFSLCLVQFVSG